MIVRNLIFLIFSFNFSLSASDSLPIYNDYSDIIASTYYDYSPEDLAILKASSSNKRITKESLQKWDFFLATLLKDNKYHKTGSYRIFAYLYTAQRDAAFLSYQAQGEFVGSLDQISLMIIRLFFPSLDPSFAIDNDPYSIKLAEIVFAKYRDRFLILNQKLEDKDSFSIFPWIGFYEEFTTPQGATPWFTSPIITKMMIPPPLSDTAFWDKQLEAIKQQQQKKINFKHLLRGFWTRYQPIGLRNWIAIGNYYIFSHDVPLPKILLFRSIFAIGLFDVVVASIKAKTYFGLTSFVDKKADTTEDAYFYSFPSLHASLAYTAASILTYFFPENKEYWKTLAYEVAFSRLAQQSDYPVNLDKAKELSEDIIRGLLKNRQFEPKGF